MTEATNESIYRDSLIELRTHLKELERLFYQRPSRGINLLDYNQNWWSGYQQRYQNLDPKTLELRYSEAVNFVYKMCCYLDVGIMWLFIIMHNAHSIKSEYREIYAGDRRWQEYCLESYNATKDELKYRYVTAQQMFGEAYPGWVVRDGDYFEQQIWPEVEDEHEKLHKSILDATPSTSIKARENLASKDQDVIIVPASSSSGVTTLFTIIKSEKASSVPAGLSGDPSCAEIVSKLTEKGWLAADGTPKRPCKDLLSCARYIVDLEWANNGLEPKPKLVRKLSKEYGLPPEGRLNHYLGSPNEWLINAKDWLK